MKVAVTVYGADHGPFDVNADSFAGFLKTLKGCDWLVVSHPDDATLMAFRISQIELIEEVSG